MKKWKMYISKHTGVLHNILVTWFDNTIIAGGDVGFNLKCFLYHMCDAEQKFRFYIRKGSSKKIPMSAAPMSR